MTSEQDLWSTDQFSLEFWFAQQIGRSPLLVEECQEADIVYIPLLTLWAENGCDEEQHERVKEFISDISNLLPHLPDKPHFMTIPRVLAFSNVDPNAFLDKGINILTIEGWAESDPAIIEVPYPSAYHRHAGLARNRFIDHALQSKSHLVFQSFALDRHADNDVRYQLHQACLDAIEDCVYAVPTWDVVEGKAFVGAFWQNASSSWYCMQPTGHTVTRKSTFDCLLAGSIPVFFDINSLHHFPWSDLLDPSELVMMLDGIEMKDLYETLAGYSLEERQARIQKIADVAHLYQYSLQPHSGLINWHNVDKINKWDDAFTFALKTLLRQLKARGLFRED